MVNITEKVDYHTDTLFGWSKAKLLEFCKNNPLPGTNKWPADHPIWDCYVAGYKSPREAWYTDSLLKKAIDNLYWITNKSILTDKYPEFVKRIREAFECEGIELLQEVQLRFTVGKIAQKVTALQDHYFTDFINESGVDISRGVYIPCCGFGGIYRGAEKWFKDRNLTPNIEAYDINPNFCKYYGWGQRDALAQIIHTDKVVVACPPFGPKTERWEGTPEDMYYTFEEWCELLMKHIVATNYIFIGPELGKSKKKNNNCGLFGKTKGIQWYPEYTYERDISSTK